MAVFHKDKIRNIALIGHGGEGKTSLLEAMLYKTKAIDRLGKVDDGNSVSDYDQEEISRKMSISLSMAYVLYKDYKFNILDCPGFFDFEGGRRKGSRVLCREKHTRIRLGQRREQGKLQF